MIVTLDNFSAELAIDWSCKENTMPDNKSIVRNDIERVWNQHDYTAIDDNIRPDYIQHSPT